MLTVVMPHDRIFPWIISPISLDLRVERALQFDALTADLNQKIESLRFEVDEFSDRNELLVSELQLNKNRLEEAAVRLSQAEASLNEKKQAYDALVAKHAAEVNELRNSTHSNDELKELQHELNAALLQSKASRGEVEALQLKIREKDGVISNLENKVIVMREELEAAQKQVLEVESENNYLKENVFRKGSDSDKIERISEQLGAFEIVGYTKIVIPNQKIAYFDIGDNIVQISVTDISFYSGYCYFDAVDYFTGDNLTSYSTRHSVGFSFFYKEKRFTLFSLTGNSCTFSVSDI
ncbi:hypothetical protein HH303_06470 [Rhodospirillaceae bacterium KN72]|uniref:Uncharacterized protein n=1 Tax=Pacificispira spongiicola TaxID=2729598 RepID=A0A7Y0DYW2_9PROT|nr:hypothetical protein [Pacificispira spongiicola]NMM44113.1 hypothetical protein [Pacificispira spongiicola]